MGSDGGAGILPLLQLQIALFQTEVHIIDFIKLLPVCSAIKNVASAQSFGQNGLWRTILKTKAQSHGFVFGVSIDKPSFVISQRSGFPSPSMLTETISDG
jgi:hypothetical protein